MESAQVVDAFVVVQLRELVGREQFASGALVVGGVAAGHALRVAGGADVYGFLAEQLAEPFGGGLLVAAEEEHAVAVADDGLPRVLYMVFNWAMVWRMMLTLTLRERIVATSLSKLGMRPTLANSSRKQCSGVARHSPG